MAEQMMQETAGKAIPAGYKQTEVGVIPEDWDVCLLKNICSSFKTGKLDANAMILDGEYRFYTCARNYYWINQYAFDDEALLISGNGANVGYIHYYKGKFNAYQRTYVLTCFSADIQFLKKQMEVNLSERIRTEVNAGNTPYITMDTLTDMMVPLPKNRQQQIAIANVLSDSDALIGALEQLIAKKQAIKSATMQQLLTGRIRLPAFALRPDGTQKGYKPSELGEIPEDWEVVSLGNLLAYEQPTKYLVSHSKFLDEGSYPVLTAGKSLVLGYTNEENGVFTDLPVIIFDDFTTDSKFVDFPFKAKSSAMKMLKPRNQKIPLSLIYNLLNSVDYLVGDHKRHWIGEFQFLNVVMPSDNEEQTAIATILSDMDNELQALTQKLDKARALKQGMMQQLLTGKIRLPLTAGA
ncbi:restriction endonuclease subunit S [Aeromonas hydrophila]|uniref:Restriction endonuclease subunit S n=1 Tax=Aeromonas media TaxID=651 RepID=A0A6M4YQK3_AERME|nr:MULTISPECIES: restriction endonuclease subunit S [Aeromonas]MBJ7580242.1 restriction endonuclease subunit S [Aeromonas veronii]QJT21523.1 restriction endonuclease subunit S [Aeromonas media]QYK82097.1 restriction endonuclease subunit S [Aeromonas media]